MQKKLRVINSSIKNRCRKGELVAIQEAIDTLYNNGLVTLRKSEDFKFNQGYLSALEELDSILFKP